MANNTELSEEDDTKHSVIRLSKKLVTAVKTIFFIICLSGFSYQASQFLKFYFSYPTVIEHRSETPDKMMAPAVTYCYVQNITRNRFCEVFPNDCYKVEKIDTHCKLFPDYCKEGIEIPLWNYTNITTTFYLEDLKNSGQDIYNTLYAIPWDLSKDEIVGPKFYAAWWSLNIFTCYTLHSRVDSNEKPKEVELDLSTKKVDPSFRYYVGYMGFALHDKKAMDPKTMVGITIEIHTPYTNTFPHMRNLLKPETRYEIEMKIKQEYLLKYPYKTDCINYTELWEENNRNGPRSRRMCVDLCEIRKEEVCFGCVDIWNLYPYTGRKCVHGISQDSDDMCNATVIKKYDDCVSDCKRECSNTKYTFSITEMKRDPWDYRGYHKGIIEVDLFMDPDLSIQTHRPQYQDVELFSYLGGYIGIWLGVSLYALTDVIKTIFVIMTPCFWKTHKRIRVSIKNRSEAKVNSNLKF